jgi:hypothetical protein
MVFGRVSEITIEICQLSVRASLAQVLDILDNCRAAQILVSVNIFREDDHPPEDTLTGTRYETI